MIVAHLYAGPMDGATVDITEPCDYLLIPTLNTTPTNPDGTWKHPSEVEYVPVRYNLSLLLAGNQARYVVEGWNP